MTFPSPVRQARRAFLAAAGAALFLAGCSTGPSERPGLPGPGGPRNKVAVLVPTTGPDAAVGSAIANAARLALADMGGNAIELTTYDTAAAGAPAAAERALSGGAGLILGPLLGDDVRTVAPLARRAGVPVLAYSNDETAAGNGAYILGLVPGQAIARVIDEARQQGAARIAALVPATTYGDRAGIGLERNFGGRVIRYGSLAEARAGLRRLNAGGGYDALLIADEGQVAAALAAQVLPSARILGPDLWAGERGLGRTARLRGALFATASDSRFGQFAARYRARFRIAPPRLASLGYDSVLLTVRAARQWPAGRRFPLRSLGEDEGFVGVDGVFRFTRAGVAERGLEVRAVTATGTQLVSPAPSHF